MTCHITGSSSKELPEGKDTPQVCGKAANGCRLAFDLGKSDIKTVAVKDGEASPSDGWDWLGVMECHGWGKPKVSVGDRGFFMAYLWLHVQVWDGGNSCVASR